MLAEWLQHPYRNSGQGMDIGNMGMMKFLNDTGSFACSQFLMVIFFIASYSLLSPFRVRFWHLRLVAGCQGITEPNLLPLLNNISRRCATIDASNICLKKIICKS